MDTAIFLSARRFSNAEARRIAYLIHDKMYLTFAQCVHGLMRPSAHLYTIANKNIRKRNAVAHSDDQISEFDAHVFMDLYNEQISFALSAKPFKI